MWVKRVVKGMRMRIRWEVERRFYVNGGVW
jgi:hypothetical protein